MPKSEGCEATAIPVEAVQFSIRADLSSFETQTLIAIAKGMITCFMKYKSDVVRSLKLFLSVAFLSISIITANASTSGVQKAANSTPQGKSNRTKSERPKSSLSVKMSSETPHTFSVKAKDSRVGDIGRELAKLLNVPVSLSPVMTNQRISVEFSGVNLEAALRLIAPHPFVDYVVSGEDAAHPKPLAIYLHALNEQSPPLNSVVKGSSEAILIEGDTEDGVGDEESQRKREEADPLKVKYEQNLLSVRAQKQPLTVVLYKIASEIGVPFELRWESMDLVDIDFANYPLEQAMRGLSPSVRFYYRMDLQTFQVQPLRLSLVAPAQLKS